MSREAPPKPIPSADPRVLARILSRVDDPEEALTAHLDPVWPRRWVSNVRGTISQPKRKARR